MNDMDIRILVACHKECQVPNDNIYFPIHVGANGKNSIGFQRDDEGNNISDLNPMYSELTALYWAWKNLTCEYLGLVHYRRYFTLHKKKASEDTLRYVLSRKEAESLLKKYTILVPAKRHYYIETIYSHYSHTFSEEQLIITGKVIMELYPEYTSAYEEFMNEHSGYMFNMFIMPKALADQYCKWIFDILTEVEREYDSSKLTSFEARYLGRLSERLFNVWLIYQVKTGLLKESDIHEIPYSYLGKIDWKRKIAGFLAAKIFHKKYDRSF